MGGTLGVRVFVAVPPLWTVAVAAARPEPPSDRPLSIAEVWREPADYYSIGTPRFPPALVYVRNGK